jgi:outer membrane protein OmpA-like peptidoglycan-associated protein
MLSAIRVWVFSLALVFLVGAAGPASAQFGGLKDKLKDKAKEKATKSAEQAVKGDSAKSGDEQQAGESTESEPAEGQTPAASGGTARAADMALYTKYDFIPGDKVIFYDDLSQEEMGEFPSRWNLDAGVFEIAKQGDRKWIMCTDKGIIYPKIQPSPLPPKYTFELEFYAKGPVFKGHWLHIRWFDAANKEIGRFRMEDGNGTYVSVLGKELASKVLPAKLSAGIHTMRIMATKSTLKCYIDSERVANVPAVEGFQPVGLRIYMDPWKDEPDNPFLIGTLRYAEGGKTLKEQLDEAGRIVTHGILFDSGSDKIKAESYKTLAEIGGLLTESPSLRVSIEGHTDSDGADAANVTLSQNRADSVKTYLVENYKVDGNRLEAKGWGEAKPIDANASPEGKANNRRVELVKL